MQHDRKRDECSDMCWTAGQHYARGLVLRYPPPWDRDWLLARVDALYAVVESSFAESPQRFSDRFVLDMKIAAFEGFEDEMRHIVANSRAGTVGHA